MENYGNLIYDDEEDLETSTKKKERKKKLTIIGTFLILIILSLDLFYNFIPYITGQSIRHPGEEGLFYFSIIILLVIQVLLVRSYLLTNNTATTGKPTFKVYEQGLLLIGMNRFYEWNRLKNITIFKFDSAYSSNLNVNLKDSVKISIDTNKIDFDRVRQIFEKNGVPTLIVDESATG